MLVIYKTCDIKLLKQYIEYFFKDDEEPKGQKYQPDGGYIPRILFLCTFIIICSIYLNRTLYMLFFIVYFFKEKTQIEVLRGKVFYTYEQIPYK